MTRDAVTSDQPPPTGLPFSVAVAALSLGAAIEMDVVVG
jgi:hypothetical protein